jgi:hypothetical protein
MVGAGFKLVPHFCDLCVLGVESPSKMNREVAGDDAENACNDC